MNNANSDAALPAIRQPVAVPPATGNIDPASLAFTEDFAFVDIEVTGLDPAVDKIIEIAILRVRSGAPEVFHTLVNPEMPIPPTASAVSHITDDMVADKPTFEQIAPDVIHMLDGAFVGSHNAPLDCLFVDGELGVDPDPAAWFCTVRLAKHLVPHAPAFGNQVLRYWFKTEPASEGLGNHRAIDDVHVSMENLRHLLNVAQNRGLNSMQQVLELSNEVIYAQTMPFGPHVGKDFEQIPGRYLKWALGQIPGQQGLDIDADLRATMERELAKADRAVDVVVPDEILNFGRQHNGKKMSEVPLEYLEWIQREKPRTCPPSVIAGVDVELKARQAQPGAAAANTKASAQTPAPAELDLKIVGLSQEAQVSFNRLAAMVTKGSSDEEALQAISHSRDPAQGFHRYLVNFASADLAEYKRVAGLTGSGSNEFMLSIAAAAERDHGRVPYREPEVRSTGNGTGRASLLKGTRQAEPDHDSMAGPQPDGDDSGPFEGASGNRRPRMR